MKAYFKAGDHQRIVRFLSENTVANLYIKDLLCRLSKEASLGDNELQNYVLFIFEIQGDSLMATNSFKKASDAFY